MGTTTDHFSQFGPNSGYVRDLFNLYQTDPSLVGDSWARYFSTIETSSPVANGCNGSPASEPLALGTSLATIPEYADGRYKEGTEHDGELEQRI